MNLQQVAGEKTTANTWKSSRTWEDFSAERAGPICSMAERAIGSLGSSSTVSYSWGNQSCRSMAIHDTDNLGQQIVRNNDPNRELRSVTTSICIRSQEPTRRVCHVADSQRVYLQLEDPTGEDDYY